MGVETVIVGALIGAGIGAGVGVASGAAKAKTARETAKTERRNAFVQSESVKRQTKVLKTRQKLLFLKSGIKLEGSPLLLLKETERIGAEKSAEIRSFGEERARQISRTGRSSFISDVFEGTSAGASLGKTTSELF